MLEFPFFSIAGPVRIYQSQNTDIWDQCPESYYQIVSKEYLTKILRGDFKMLSFFLFNNLLPKNTSFQGPVLEVIVRLCEQKDEAQLLNTM